MATTYPDFDSLDLDLRREYLNAHPGEKPTFTPRKDDQANGVLQIRTSEDGPVTILVVIRGNTVEDTLCIESTAEFIG